MNDYDPDDYIHNLNMFRRKIFFMVQEVLEKEYLPDTEIIGVLEFEKHWVISRSNMKMVEEENLERGVI